jgi:hypothetical protein
MPSQDGIRSSVEVIDGLRSEHLHTWGCCDIDQEQGGSATDNIFVVEWGFMWALEGQQDLANYKMKE